MTKLLASRKCHCFAFKWSVTVSKTLCPKGYFVDYEFGWGQGKNWFSPGPRSLPICSGPLGSCFKLCVVVSEHQSLGTKEVAKICPVPLSRRIPGKAFPKPAVCPPLQSSRCPQACASVRCSPTTVSAVRSAWLLQISLDERASFFFLSFLIEISLTYNIILVSDVQYNFFFFF